MRILPDRSTLPAMPDRALLLALRPLANLCAGRRLFAGHIFKG